MNAVQVSAISTSYATGFELENISLSLEQGAFVGLIGPNGAGKSTLLKTIGGLLNPKSGAISILEKPLTSYSRRQLAQVLAGVMQEHQLPFDFSVEETVLMGRNPYLDRLQREGPADFAAAQQAMRLANVQSMSERKLSELSGGERQRVMLARALAQGPKVLLLDEPTSHLDLLHQLELMEILRDLNHTQGLTLLVALHELNLAARYCDTLLALKGGRLLCSGPPAEVLTPERLVELFGVSVDVRQSRRTGRPEVLMGSARPALHYEATGAGRRLHVFCGGGSAAPFLSELSRQGFELSIGPVNLGDSDHQLARELGAEVAVEQPFSPLGDGVLAEATRLAVAAELLILAATPISQGNLASLKLARQLQQAHKPLILWGNFAGCDFTGTGEAEALLTDLEEAGALRAESLPDLLSLLATL